MAGSRVLRGMAGFMILLSLFLHWKLDGADLMRLSWLWMTGFIGLSLFQSMFTGWCPGMMFLAKLGIRDKPKAS